MELFIGIALTLLAAGGVYFGAIWIRARRARGRQRFFIAQTLRQSKRADNRRIIVSLSTLPDRIANLRPTLDCLLNQTRPPDEIVLAIPAFSIRQQREYVLPDFLNAIARLTVLRTEEDFGPATKFIPAIQREFAEARADTLIMVLDDDRTYPRDAIETYLHFAAELRDAALCFRGGPMPRSLDWRDSKLTLADKIARPQRVAVMTGCGSYLVQPRFFDASLWDYSAAPRGAFYMDDIWISGCLDRRGVRKYVVPASSMMESVQVQKRTMTLHDVPRGRRQNNNETIAYFKESWDVFAAK